MTLTMRGEIPIRLKFMPLLLTEIKFIQVIEAANTATPSKHYE
jgi:hypothetical protein